MSQYTLIGCRLGITSFISAAFIPVGAVVAEGAVAVENIAVGDFVEAGEDGLLRRARSIPEEFSHLPHVEFIGIDPARVEPPQTQAPAICQNCRNYHGQSYGGNFVVCGIHPYGNGEDCSDAE